MEPNSNIYDLASDFALHIVYLYKSLSNDKHEYVMSKQLLRSGTSVGANVFEAKNAFSRDDFAYKMSISLKEAGESGFWIDLLHRASFLTDEEYNSLYQEWNHLYAVLVKIVKSTKPQTFKIENPSNSNQQQ